MRPIYDHAEWHTTPPSDLCPTCEDLQPKEDPAASWVIRKWIDKFHDSFWQLKAIVGLVDFSG